MLEVKDLHVNYGAVHALNGISLHVDDGEIVSLIGANGAGKTTTLRTITGLEKAASGSVMFDGHDLRKAEPSKIITYKLAHVPEGRHIFPQMTVEENLEMGAYADPAGMEETMKRQKPQFYGQILQHMGVAYLRMGYSDEAMECLDNNSKRIGQM